MIHASDSPFTEKFGRWQRIDAWIERASEKLNPILVKEARQALKSRQFLVTFTLLLICGWGWSLLGVAILSPSVYYAPSGPFMLIGFYYILAVPLLLIVPFTAYRSLAAEREDGTYELLSISMLTARQIVTGKLGSAILQMIVFYSALSPCIAFTYLLRGVDIITIMVVLFYTFLMSVLLSAIGLLVATATSVRHIQVLLSVVLLLGLVAATITWCFWIAVMVYESASFPWDDAYVWISQAAVISGFITYFALIVLAASAQISFASDNRSTKLRIVMLAQQVVFIAWMAYAWMDSQQNGVLLVMLSFCGIHWAIMGSLMIGEQAQLSPRVRRQLPVSILGRAFLTWFNPGSGTGYVFAVVNLLAACVAGVVLAAAGQLFGFQSFAGDLNEVAMFSVLLLAYVATYLGVARILTVAMRQYLYFGLMLPFLLTTILVVLGAAMPLFLQAWLNGFNNMDYTVLQATNWAWTLGEAADGDALATAPEAVVLVLLAGAAVFFINLFLAAREIEETRTATPDRVLADELELHPEKIAQPKKPRDPFADE